MKTVAIISEYNPFHSGHFYQIQSIRKEFGEDTRIVAIMSGNYTQRGQIAMMDKSARAKMAVLCGVNLVLELPFPYSLGSAEFFARAGVSIADRIGGIDLLSFGSECGDLSLLEAVADRMRKRDFLDQMKKIAKENPALGHAELLEEALAVFMDREDAKKILRPNNILALEYLKALKHLGSKIKPHTVFRSGTDYNATDINQEKQHQSASAIREKIAQNDISALDYIPKEAKDVVLKQIESGAAPCKEEALSAAILSYFRLNSPSNSCRFQDAKGGLYNRLITMSYEATDISSLAALTETKKFTNARIRRAIWYSFFGVTSSDVKSAPAFTRVLALDKEGQAILHAAKATAKIPIVTKPSEALPSEKGARCKLLSDRADAVFQLSKPEKTSGSHAMRTSPFFKK
jgi:predicted nucleotidyltransferase